MNIKKLLLFDVDGTLAESGKQIDDEMLFELQNLHNSGYHLGIVGGGKLEKILYQIKNTNLFTHLFTECGCVYHLNTQSDILNLKNIYTKNIRNHNLYQKINILVKQALYFISQVDYTVTGNFIDLRNGIIYISLIGMTANDSEREYFIEKNKQNNYRTNLLNILHQKAQELEISNDITICEGGKVGIGLYPKEYDKIQVLEHLDEYNEIHYFGDKYEPNGNDYNLITHNNIIGHPVNNIIETKNILHEIFKSNA